MPRSKFTSLSKLPLWLISSLVILVASLVSLIYFFRKGSTPRTHPKGFVGDQTQESKPTQFYEIKNDHLEPATLIVPSNSISFDNIDQPQETENPITRWVKSLSGWSFPPITVKQVKTFAGPFLALVVAYFAQGIFGSTIGEGGMKNWIWLGSISIPNRLWFGATFYLFAMVVWAIVAPPIHSLVSVINQSNPGIPQKSHYHPVRFCLLSISICTYFVSILLFVINGENGLIRVLWAIGLICFILSQIPWPGIHSTSHPEAEESPPFRWQHWLALALILAVAFWLRFYKLATIPNDFTGDMAAHGLIARDYLFGIENKIFGYSFDIPTMGFLPTILSMAIFGNNLFGLQMSSVIGGLFSLLAIYLLIWRLFDNHRLAIITTILVAINAAHIHFSRTAGHIGPWSFGCLSLFFFIDGLKARRLTSFGLAGVLLGFGTQMYYSGRVLVFIIGLFLLYVLFIKRFWVISNKHGLAMIVVGFLITMGPGLIFNIMHWNSYISRAREVMIFSSGAMAHLLNKYNTDSPVIVLLTQIKLSLLMFNQSMDSSVQVGFPHPMFNPLISPLILLGLGFSLRRWKDVGLAFILIWLTLMLVLGSIITLDAPSWPHLVGIVPPAAFLAAVVLDQILVLSKQNFGDLAAKLLTIAITILLATTGYINWNQYYSAVKENAAAPVVIGRYINSLPLDVTACSLLSGTPLNVRETLFLAWPHKLIDISPLSPDSELDICTGSSLVWVISPENIGRLDEIRSRWPNGMVQNYNFPHYDYPLTFYLVDVVPPTIP